MAQSSIGAEIDLVPARIVSAADAHPTRLAIGDAVAPLSFAALAEASAAHAAALAARGVAAGTLVGVALERGAPRIAATLAIWRLGAAALLLDPAWPAMRRAQIVAESGCDLVLDEAALLALPAAAAERPADATLRAEDLAYVIYTSGSSGRPKGVEITHGNLAALVDWHNAAFALSPADRASHLAGLAFDAAVWEVWPPLAAGASVHPVPEDARTSAERLRDWLVAERITTAFAPTLLAEQVVRLPWPETALRLLLTGGDRLRAPPPAGLPFALVNNYGPTECTVVATSGVVPPAGAGADQRPPAIGRPIAGVTIHILDEAGSPVAAGAVGEIAIGGATVGRGYRGEPEATAAAFIADRLGGGPGARLYRTGDLGRLRADGAIEFHGRADAQLKIRGQRVEPEEVAAMLLGHPAVRSAAVAGVSAPDGTTLAAYIVAEGEPPGADDLHAYLRERLPAAWVPAAFVALPALPVTAHGKLDRAALPLPTPENSLSAHAPATTVAAGPVEARVLAILGEVMGTREIGLDDNFFLLGGHSLLGTQVVLRASDAFGIELTLRHLFHAPTARALAATIEGLVEEAVLALSEEELALRIHG